MTYGINWRSYCEVYLRVRTKNHYESKSWNFLKLAWKWDKTQNFLLIVISREKVWIQAMPWTSRRPLNERARTYRLCHPIWSSPQILRNLATIPPIDLIWSYITKHLAKIIKSKASPWPWNTQNSIWTSSLIITRFPCRPQLTKIFNKCWKASLYVENRKRLEVFLLTFGLRHKYSAFWANEHLAIFIWKDSNVEKF